MELIPSSPSPLVLVLLFPGFALELHFVFYYKNSPVSLFVYFFLTFLNFRDESMQSLNTRFTKLKKEQKNRINVLIKLLYYR